MTTAGGERTELIGLGRPTVKAAIGRRRELVFTFPASGNWRGDGRGHLLAVTDLDCRRLRGVWWWLDAERHVEHIGPPPGTTRTDLLRRCQAALRRCELRAA